MAKNSKSENSKNSRGETSKRSSGQLYSSAIICRMKGYLGEGKPVNCSSLGSSIIQEMWEVRRARMLASFEVFNKYM